MTLRQKLLKLAYPLLMQLRPKPQHMPTNTQAVQPPQSFYGLSAVLNNGQPFSFDQLRGKKVLLVNTASNCGYTGQYAELQQLHAQRKDDLVILGFPANDFKEQERGSDEEIAQFCQVNYGVQFPLAKKSQVVRGEGQHPVYQWLTDKTKNGWNDRQPEWNFSKYLINEEGMLTHYFGAGVSPLAPEVQAAL